MPQYIKKGIRIGNILGTYSSNLTSSVIRLYRTGDLVEETFDNEVVYLAVVMANLDVDTIGTRVRRFDYGSGKNGANAHIYSEVPDQEFDMTLQVTKTGTKSIEYQLKGYRSCDAVIFVIQNVE